MTNTQLVSSKNNELLSVNSKTKQFVTMMVGDQLFGIPVLMVEDVLRPQKITKIPLASDTILGAINLRGRIVTVINMRRRLGIEDHENSYNCMHVVVEHKDEQYSFIVDKIGDVLKLSLDDFEKNPANLSSNWQDVSLGVYRLDGKILVVLDVESLLNL